ncbi:hypothetical protein HDA40_003131 [Hamadaea flava]|uniref:Prevent-host-death family protein n=1 Tax=Hamadaea flava TaxID=1742688 RepID=A0ABV8LWI9_9ACTN|nr:hypothetical protein [Hamadaea flava]MCP2324624.1 hypothetical protein [Hamadaea flava]
MTAVPLDSVPFSELLREPAATVERLLRVRALRLRRRDADDLVLMSADRADREGQVVDLTTRLLSEIARTDPHLLAGLLPRVLPWVRFLPAEAIDEFAKEFVAIAAAAADLGNMASVSVVLTAWRNTAEAYSDPELFAILRDQTTGDFGTVPLPDAP